MAKTSLRVPAWKDGFPIAVIVYTPVGEIYDTEKMVALINPATGVPQAFYSKFAR
jgi:predicted alpha/beta hydrolase